MNGQRTGFGALRAGGLNWDALPLRLFSKGNAKFWNPDDLDFSVDAEQWAATLSGPAYALDDESAIRTVDGALDVISEGHWRFFP